MVKSHYFLSSVYVGVVLITATISCLLPTARLNGQADFGGQPQPSAEQGVLSCSRSFERCKTYLAVFWRFERPRQTGKRLKPKGQEKDRHDGRPMIYIMNRAKTENCLVANDELPTLDGRLGNFRYLKRIIFLSPLISYLGGAPEIQL